MSLPSKLYRRIPPKGIAKQPGLQTITTSKTTANKGNALKFTTHSPLNEGIGGPKMEKYSNLPCTCTQIQKPHQLPTSSLSLV